MNQLIVNKALLCSTMKQKQEYFYILIALKENFPALGNERRHHKKKVRPLQVNGSEFLK